MCCGTHVPNLAMLQCVKLLHAEPIKGNMRVHFVVGVGAMAMLGDLFDRVRVLCVSVAVRFYSVVLKMN